MHFLSVDNSSVAEELKHKVRILCMVMTIQQGHSWKMRYTKETWGKKCTKLLFMSDIDDPSIPSVKVDVEPGRDHLTAKTMKSFELAYIKYFKEYDWFLKADDDTYVIVENMRYFLNTQSTDEPVYFGHNFRTSGVRQGYFSGGGGYVLSKEALRRLALRPLHYCAEDYGAEDIEIGKCMENLGVKTGESRDELGRTRFHGLSPDRMLGQRLPTWFSTFDKFNGSYVSIYFLWATGERESS